ncbi:alpha/beta hydrolase [Arcicella aquatica]|uniref:Alpha/beta hydrolase n=1 Tax=Arcicella aquatica TaxID=217141 RepID=A0ABU5QSS5_9BACT|nr:alpha/beta hydrolase [Arcicella aquatica]MEA5259910.1 alpha/beta hydrolase [Arcicella aquatica]
MELHFQKFGNGQKILLAFHGIGQDFLCFQQFGETFGDTYTTYAFDLPFHGKSLNNHPINGIITKNIWKDFLNSFLHQNKIDSFSIVGFSMGGRFALATLEAFPEKVENLILIAPDGISEHPIYAFATHFNLTRRLFKYVIFKEDKLLVLTKLFAKMRIVPESSIRFAHRMLDTPRKKKQVFESWTGFRHLKFNMSTLAKIIHSRNIKVSIFTGKYDTILPTKQVLPLSQKLPNVQMIILEAGHTKMLEKVVEYLQMNDKII